MPSAGDVDLFQDDDGKVYVYSGVSDVNPIVGARLDPASNYSVLGGYSNLFYGAPSSRGWENKFTRSYGPIDKDLQTNSSAPYIEGAWMNKINGRYYLQYAAPGTDTDFYGDGVFVANQPLGPFTYQPNSPFSFRPTSFAGGAGHGSTFQDSRGNYWHAATISIGKHRSFERRLGMFPVKVFSDGQLAGNTYLADYPQYLPGVTADPFTSNSPGWMLLSLNKPVTVSSTNERFIPEFAVDESIKTWWCAATGNSGEWVRVDLGSVATIQALQLNFADEGSTVNDRLINDAYRYVVEVSNDGQNWQMLVDKSQNQKDAPHEYIQLSSPASARYVRLTNLHTPAGAKFSVSGLRVFGNTSGPSPAQVTGIKVERAVTDGRCGRIQWNAATNAEFYIVRSGNASDRMFSNCQVYNGTSLEVSTLNTGGDYYATVDAVNGKGITVGPVAVKMTNTWTPANTAPKPLLRNGWTASASVTNSSDSTVSAIDGDRNTRWSTGATQQSGQWFQVDTGGTSTFDQIVLDTVSSSGDYSCRYEVAVSNNGTTWSSPIAVGFGNPAVTTINFPRQTARYVRVNQTGSSLMWWGIYEFNLYLSSQS